MRAWPRGGVFSLVVLSERDGASTLRVHGAGAASLFADESGGHRWQRVPPTEKRGRVQTSTVTVAVLSEPPDDFVGFSLNDVEIVTARGHGKGGQHRNKTESAIQATHRPTGLTAYCQSERSQHSNKAAALAVLRARVFEHERAKFSASRDDARRGLIGSGQRGDKRRTLRARDNQVTDHVTGRTWHFDRYVRGDW